MSVLDEPAKMIAPPLVEIEEPLSTFIKPSPLWLEVFSVDPDRAQSTTAPPLVVMVLLVPVMMLAVAFRIIFPVAEVVTARVPPVVTDPDEAVTDIPFAPDEDKLAEDIVVAVLVMLRSPAAVSAAPIETAPVAGILMLPDVVDAVMLALTVTAAP